VKEAEVDARELLPSGPLLCAGLLPRQCRNLLKELHYCFESHHPFYTIEAVLPDSRLSELKLNLLSIILL